MSEVDVALNDEGQQYGNLDEASAIGKQMERTRQNGTPYWFFYH